MNRAELAIVVILRLLGVGGLLAVPAIFMPHSWMNACHQYLGLGEMPDAPIVSYLARSLSAFYALVGGMALFVSCELRRYRDFIHLWSVLFTAMGFVLLGVDISSGMPMLWTLLEGPPTIALGLLVFFLRRRIETGDAVEKA